MLALLCALSLFFPLTADDMSDALARMQKSKEEAEKASDFILANAHRAPAPNLFIASAIMLERKRTEDAAFLFYAAQIRRRLDRQRFLPSQSGADDPDIALGALSQQIGAAVNPAIMRQPKQFSAAIERVAAWTPETPKNYDPGWKFAKRPDYGSKGDLDMIRGGFLEHMRPIATLLNRADYFAAFVTVQDFNFAAFEETRKPERIRAKEAAEKKMAAIEKETGIEGLYYKK